MVRFTLRDTRKSSSLRLDLSAEDGTEEILNIAAEYWGGDGPLMRNGYRLVGPHERIGESIHDGDLVELIPDPASFRF